MKRFDIINSLIKKFDYKIYLEIGVRRAEDCFDKINVTDKDAVDPNPLSKKINYPMTSDEFFKDNKKMYDIIFIDGLHQEYQVDIDIKESLKILNEEGTIVIHDCNPASKHRQTETSNGGSWNGTVWKSFVKLRFTNPNLNMFTINTDQGCGIVRRGVQEVLDQNKYKYFWTYPIFVRYRKLFLNLISPEEFTKRLENGSNI